MSMYALHMYLYHTTMQLGQTAIFLAAEKGHSHIVDILIQGKANLNIQNRVSTFVLLLWCALLLAMAERLSMRYTIIRQCGL